jgi:hypothetical protein
MDPAASPLDRLLAIASLCHTFDLPGLSAIDRELAGHTAWDAAIRLPFVKPVGAGRYRLHPPVADGLAAAVRRQRPWQARIWQRRAIAACRARLRDDPRAIGDIWLEVARLGRGAPWFDDLHPGAERGWRIHDWAAAVPPTAWQAGPDAGALWRRATGRLVVTDGQGGGVLATGALTSAPDDCPTLHLAGPSGGAQCVLLRELLGRLAAPGPVAVCTTCADVHRAADRLGWVPTTPAADGRSRSRGDTRGLADGVWPPLGRPTGLLDNVESGTTAREALAALHTPARLPQTVLGAWCASQDPGVSPARWILDALDSADLRVGSVDGGALLRAYYVDRAGSHEALAERCNLPRTSYFRAHRRALAALGAALASADWGGPPLDTSGAGGGPWRCIVRPPALESERRAP